MTLSLLSVVVGWGVGGFISGIVGIGGAMFAVPIAALFLPMHDVVLISCILNLSMDVGLVALHWRHCRFRSVPPMLLGAIPGSILGVYVLQWMSENVLKLVVGIMLFVFIWWQKVVHVGHGKESWGVAGVAGMVSGVLGSAISFDGPPVAAYALYAGWGPRVVLGTLGAYFLARGPVTCFVQWNAGMYTTSILLHAAWGVPAAILGTLAAYPVAKRLTTESFARLMPIILTLGALSCIWAALRDML